MAYVTVSPPVLLGARENLIEHGNAVIGPTLATFPISTRPAGRSPGEVAVQLGPVDAMRYRRPPVTVPFDDLSQRGLPRLLFVNHHLPEGVTVCDVDVFAAMIEEAYQAAGPCTTSTGTSTATSGAWASAAPASRSGG
jgi:hypothetical protein